MPYVLTNKGKVLSTEEFFEILMEFTIIFVGEDHDSGFSHESELTILTVLSERDSNLILALEMFERDVQGTLDDYLKGTIPEDQFLEKARAWPNYASDYRPLVELAKGRGIPVIAANIPRKAAAAVAKGNKVSPKALGKDHVYLPATLHLDSQEYYERFAATMNIMPHFSPMKGVNVKALFKAQVLKDAVMAASLEPYLENRILFFCGHFHSDFHLGIPYQLQKNHPELKVTVVTTSSSIEDVPMKDRSRMADFIWLNE
jgi:uncharacterized iron-regulated protein